MALILPPLCFLYYYSQSVAGVDLAAGYRGWWLAIYPRHQTAQVWLVPRRPPPGSCLHLHRRHVLLEERGTQLAQGTHSNCIFKFPVFSLFSPCPTQIFPVPIYVICDYYRHKTDLADFKKKNSRQISKYLLPLESGKLQLGKNKFPVFWQNYFFGHFPCAVGTLLSWHYKI